MDNVALIQNMYQAFGRGDLTALLAACDPNIEWSNPGPSSPAYFGTHRGREAVARNIFGFLAEHVRFDRFEPYEFFSAGDKVAVLVRMEAVVLRNQTRIVQDAVHVFTCRDGAVLRLQDFQNSYALAEALR